MKHRVDVRPEREFPLLVGDVADVLEGCWWSSRIFAWGSASLNVIESSVSNFWKDNAMRKTLLGSVAALALITSNGLAAAQSSGAGMKGGGSLAAGQGARR
jgi:hypothetical protein